VNLIDFYTALSIEDFSIKTRLFGLPLVVFLVLLPYQPVSAQDSTRGKISEGFAISGGVNLPNFYGTNINAERLNYDMLPGFHAGININIPLVRNIFLQPGFLYFVKGAKQEILEDQIRTTILSYLEMPVNLLFRPCAGDGHILLGFGPFLALGLKGKELNGEYGSLPVRFLNEADINDDSHRYYKPVDSGMNIFAGYEMLNGIFFQIDSQLGFLRINSFYPEDDAAKRNIGFGLSGGYRF